MLLNNVSKYTFKYATEQSNVKSQTNVLHFNLLQMAKFSHKVPPSMRVYIISFPKTIKIFILQLSLKYFVLNFKLVTGKWKKNLYYLVPYEIAVFVGHN